MRSRLYLFLLLCALILAGYCWTRPGTSLCWAGEQHTLLQVQFSPYYWHRNRVLYEDITAFNLIESPDHPGHQALELVTPRFKLIYGFAASDWVTDLPEFHAEVQNIIINQSGISCRFRWATLGFISALLVGLVCSVLLMVTFLKRAPNKR